MLISFDELMVGVVENIHQIMSFTPYFINTEIPFNLIAFLSDGKLKIETQNL